MREGVFGDDHDGDGDTGLIGAGWGSGGMREGVFGDDHDGDGDGTGLIRKVANYRRVRHEKEKVTPLHGVCMSVQDHKIPPPRGIGP